MGRSIEEERERIHDLEEVFREIDADGSNSIDYDEFSRVMADPRVKGFFRTFGLTSGDAPQIFRLLDADESKSVSCDEFVAGCMQLTGTATSVDIKTVILDNKRMMRRWTEFASFVHQEFQ